MRLLIREVTSCIGCMYRSGCEFAFLNVSLEKFEFRNPRFIPDECPLEGIGNNRVIMEEVKSCKNCPCNRECMMNSREFNDWCHTKWHIKSSLQEIFPGCPLPRIEPEEPYKALRRAWRCKTSKEGENDETPN